MLPFQRHLLDDLDGGLVGETSGRDCEDLNEASMTSSIEVKDIECDLGLFTPTKGGGE